MNATKEISAIIKKLREEKKISQKALGHPQQFYLIAVGNYRPTQKANHHHVPEQIVDFL